MRRAITHALGDRDSIADIPRLHSSFPVHLHDEIISITIEPDRYSVRSTA
ncbi:unnamed protein product [Penicillium roqueforti FM164]|uniref:Genomic scaffold, ProqFM164S01 n=1 Tax=Penicillium roqueforti (strain FM164) TaxID=1365484 RepID=W6PS96_PENRF|nr:unnamed protein product [Penicillium roqueforti FM164]